MLEETIIEFTMENSLNAQTITFNGGGQNTYALILSTEY